MNIKNCTKCGLTKPITEYRKHTSKTCKKGWYYVGVCIDCESKIKSKWYYDNQEREKLKRKKDYIEHRDEYLARAKKRINTDSYRKYQREYAKAHPENRHSIPETLWKCIKRMFDYKCAYCGCKPKTLQIEHVVPRSRGGNNSPLNIVPACKSCNSSKSDTPINTWILVEV